MSLFFEKVVKPIVRIASHILPDEPYLRLKYQWAFGKRLNLENPTTFSEKLQWLKLYDRNPLYTDLVDKNKVKEYVARIIGSEYIIPTYEVWNSAEDINLNSLPNSFVLKGTHDGGSVILCKNKNDFNLSEAKKKLRKSLKKNYYWHGREWPYKDVQPRIIAEAYMEDEGTKELRDYKFFCFDGIVKALFIASDRQKPVDTKFDFFDSDGKHLDIRQGHPNAEVPPELPINFELMKQLASTLSKGFPQIRVDFYEVNGKVYFGELTFSHFDGMVPFIPEKWDEIFGSYIHLPKK